MAVLVQVDGFSASVKKEGLPLVPPCNLESMLPPSTMSKAGVVTWSPPTPNWNPWRGANIDEGPLASASMEDSIASDWGERLKSDTELRQRNKERMKLPIYRMRSEILGAVQENGVLLVRGNTGCGKTTQVCQYKLDDWVAAEQGAYCNIICTQPWRISAISVAERVASGYSVRFESVLPRS